MESIKDKPRAPIFQSDLFLILAIIIVFLAAIALSMYAATRTAQEQAPSPAKTVITQQMLADQYGLDVNLIAVTAAGGMLDLRLRIIDGEKARALLEDQANFPALRADNGLVIQASQDIASQPIKFEDGGDIFVLYPNSQNAVKPGDPVSIVLGDLQVKAIPAQ